PAASAAKRAGLFAAIYLAAYIAFGVPVIVAGALLGAIGVTTIAAVFGAAIAIDGHPATSSRGTDTGRNTRSPESGMSRKGPPHEHHHLRHQLRRRRRGGHRGLLGRGARPNGEPKSD